MEEHQPPISLHMDLKYGACRVPASIARSSKRGEIVLANENATGLIHSFHIERLEHKMGIHSLKRGGHWGVENCIAVLPAYGLPPGVEIVGHLRAGVDGDVPRQMRVEGAEEALRRKGCWDFHCYHLSPGMNTGIGAAGSDRRGPHPCELHQSLLQFPLNGRCLGLNLKPVVSCPLILNQQSKFRHSANITSPSA